MDAKTKFSGSDILTATDFGKMIDCSLNAVKKMIDEKKLTEGVSYLREKNKILISVFHAREELISCTNPKTCKNPKLLEFLDLDKGAKSLGVANDDVSKLSGAALMEELRRSELRLSLMEERILDKKYVERRIVEMNLESMGIEIRDSLTGLSARVTPQLRAAPTDHEAELILYAEVEKILFKLSGQSEKDISAEK